MTASTIFAIAAVILAGLASIVIMGLLTRRQQRIRRPVEVIGRRRGE